jgi:RecG-like helicase
VGLKELRKRFTASLEEVNQERLQERFADTGVTRIAEVPARERVRVCGEVSAIQVVPRAGSPWLEVTVDDGTGRAVAVFSGRKRIAGVEPGRGIVLEGVARKDARRVQLLNPCYTLLA